MFWDRIVQYPGRVKATDVDSGIEYIYDILRAEGDVTDEGTFLDSDGFDEALKSYFDISQFTANFISDNLCDDTGITLASEVTGSVRYGITGSMKYVMVKLVVATAIDGEVTLATGVPAAYRPTQDILSAIRGNDRVKLKLTSDGELLVDGEFAVGQQLFTDFAY